jgi:hypothetical protein
MSDHLYCILSPFTYVKVRDLETTRMEPFILFPHDVVRWGKKLISVEKGE